MTTRVVALGLALVLFLMASACGDSTPPAGLASQEQNPLPPSSAPDGGNGEPNSPITSPTTPRSDRDAASDASRSDTPDGGVPPEGDGPCTGKTGATGDVKLSLAGGRTAEVHVPPTYDATKRTMLVFNMHGFTSDVAQEKLLAGMNAASDTKNFLVVYPQGIGNSFNAGDCCGDARSTKVDDVAFVKEILAAVRKDYCVDPRRTFATGMSNGGFLAHRLACEMSDTFAAIAPVAGVLGVPNESCNPPRPVPVLHFHGNKDPIVPYPGGKPLGLELGYQFRSVADSTAHWRKHNACEPTSKNILTKGDTSCEQWSCAAKSEVVLCTIEGGGHTWPGGFPIIVFGKTSRDVNATEMMLTFFESHPMPM